MPAIKEQKIQPLRMIKNTFQNAGAVGTYRYASNKRTEDSASADDKECLLTGQMPAIIE